MFKPHYGTCLYPNCNKTKAFIVVKAGWCQECNYKHKQQKKKEFSKPPINKYSYVKPKTGEADLFYTIWTESNQRCFVCNKPIIYPIASNFMHVLPKALNKYPLFKLFKKNIVLGCHDGESSCHFRFDKAPRSTLTEPMWQKVFKLEAELKEEYKSFKSEIIKNKF